MHQTKASSAIVMHIIFIAWLGRLEREARIGTTMLAMTMDRGMFLTRALSLQAARKRTARAGASCLGPGHTPAAMGNLRAPARLDASV